MLKRWIVIMQMVRSGNRYEKSSFLNKNFIIKGQLNFFYCNYIDIIIFPCVESFITR